MQVEKITDHKKPKVEILPIDSKDIDKYWPLAEFMIKEALRFSGGFATSDHIKEALEYAEMQLFLAFGHEGDDVNKVFAVVVTRITELERLRQLEGIICTGTKRELWTAKMADMMEIFAKQGECDRICMLMRPGWSKVMKKFGWKMKHIEMVKELI